MPSTPFQIGQLFGTFEDLKRDIQEWAIADKFEYRVLLKDRQRVDYRCKTSDVNCIWRVFATLSPSHNDIKISKLNIEHTCIGAALPLNSRNTTYNTQSWLQKHILKHLNVTKKTTPREVQDTIQIHYGEKISYQSALKACSILSNNILDYEKLAYHHLPAYLDRLHNSNPSTYIDLSTIPDHDIGTNTATGKLTTICRFHRVFISPKEAQLSFQSCRKFIAVDRTFCKARYVQTLLLAVTVDANGHILLLAWAIVESENKDSWSYFMHHLKCAIPDSTKSTIMSDRDKGLLSAEEIVGPSICRAHCCFHLRENFKTRFGVKLTEKHFWKIAHAKTIQQYEERISLLRQEKKAAADYLAKTEKECWVQAFFPGRRYGHYTSNIVESLNHHLNTVRDLPIVDLLNEIWHSQMALRFKRLQEASNPRYNLPFTQVCITEAETSRLWAQSNSVRIADYFCGEIQQRIRVEGEQENERIFIVNLQTKSCTCKRFQENEIPCSHAVALILALNQAPRNFYPDILSVDTWRKTYSTNWKPFTTENLLILPVTANGLNMICYLPVTRRLPGRPKKKRAQKGDKSLSALNYARKMHGEEVPKSEQKCSRCKKQGTGHNARTCIEVGSF